MLETTDAKEALRVGSHGPIGPVEKRAGRHVWRPGENGVSVLLVARLFKMPYRVLRCIEASGAKVYVLGNRSARGLGSSRYCREFCETDRPIDGSADDELAGEINRQVQRLGISIVLAGDPPSTRSLIAMRERVAAPCFPMPSLAQFDALNDKWQFAQLCGRLNVRRPDTRLFNDVAELRRALGRGTLPFPKMIAKPLALDGGRGCVVFSSDNLDKKISDIRYSPILVQEFVPGEDVGASVYCVNGEIKSFIAHRYRRATYSTFFEQRIFDDIAKIARHLNVDGVLNFDMRLTEGGDLVYLECNPRFFFKIAMSMLAGVNFVAAGLPGCGAPPRPEASQTIRFPKALLAALPTPWRLKGGATVLRHLLADPAPWLREELGLEPDASRS